MLTKFLKLFILIMILFYENGFASLSASEILNKVENLPYPQTSKTENTQIIDRNGKKITLKFITYSMGKDEKMLLEYTYPPRTKGLKILILDKGKNIYFYSPRTGRIRKIPTHQRNRSVNGSDFSYEDITEGSYREKFNYEKIGEDEKFYKIKLIPKKPDEYSYAYLIIYVEKPTFLLKKIEIYDKKTKELFKIMEIKSYKKIKNYNIPTEIIMKNLFKNSITTIKTTNIEINTRIDKSLFEPQKLGR